MTNPIGSTASVATGFSAAGSGDSSARAPESATTTSTPAPSNPQTSSQSLPATAPASSLIHMNGAHQGQNPNILSQVSQQQSILTNQALQHARYAMLLQAAGTVEQQSNAVNPLAAVAALTQHLVKHVAMPSSNQSVASSIPTPASTMSSITPYAHLLASQSTLSAPSITTQTHSSEHQSLATLRKLFF